MATVQPGRRSRVIVFTIYTYVGFRVLISAGVLDADADADADAGDRNLFRSPSTT